MNPLDDQLLGAIFRTNGNGRLLQPEDQAYEYKEIFDRDSKEAKAKYAKELAALHNYKGGYLVFGITDAGDVTGLHNFTAPDNADLANDINACFSPAFHFSSRSFVIEGRTVFIIHVQQRTSIPTVCIKNHPGVLSSATIYWRYAAQSAPIEAGDLISLLHSLRGEETARLTAIQETDLKLRHKPYLRYDGGQGGMDQVKINITNTGARATLLEINVLEGQMRAEPYFKLPFVVSLDQRIVIPMRTTDNSVANNKTYKLEIVYTDEIGTRYRAIGDFRGASGKLSELEEIK